MDELRGKVAVVTGAAGGLGLALVRCFASNGMTVVAADRDEETLAKATDAVAGVGGEVVGMAVDVSDPASVDALRDQTFERFGTAHVVCNNAAVFAFGRMVESIDLERWRRTIDVNLFGVLHGVRSFLPRLLEQGVGGRVRHHVEGTLDDRPRDQAGDDIGVDSVERRLRHLGGEG